MIKLIVNFLNVLSAAANSNYWVQLNSSLVIVENNSKQYIWEEKDTTYHEYDEVKSIPSVAVVGQQHYVWKVSVGQKHHKTVVWSSKVVEILWASECPLENEQSKSWEEHYKGKYGYQNQERVPEIMPNQH